MSGNCEADFQGLREWDLQPAYPKKLFEWVRNGDGIEISSCLLYAETS